MQRDTFADFMKEPLIPVGTKIEVYLAVIIGVRQASMMVFPYDLPDASILGATIDERFRQKIQGKWVPGDSIGDYLSRQARKLLKRSPAAEARYKVNLLSEIYEDVIKSSPSYESFMSWAAKLGLKNCQLQSRPTIREIFLFKSSDLSSSLDALQDLRKDLRYEATRRAPQGVPPVEMAFPEQFNPEFLRTLGKLLGYPSCCVERYVFDRKSRILSPEERASNQIKEMGENEKPDIFAYFVRDFLPCTPWCEEASTLGRKLMHELGQIDSQLPALYEKRLQENVSFVLKYPEMVRERARELERIRVEATKQDRRSHDGTGCGHEDHGEAGQG